MKRLYRSISHLDQRCYESYKLSEDLLMEHAARAIADHIKRVASCGSVLIVAGPGNNGGDGVAVARQLLGEYDVKLFMPYGAKSKMCQLQLERFIACGGKLIEELQSGDIVVDALFGSGLSKLLKEDIVKIISDLNSMDGVKIACDIPTGIDINGNPFPIAFKADVTITMGARKLALYMDKAKDYVGEVEVADLGISSLLYEEESSYFLLEESDMKLPIRVSAATNKGDFGHLAVIGGEKEGAAIMAGLAALRFGAGLVTVVSFEKFTTPYVLMHSNALPKKTTAIAVGMGLGMEYSDKEFEELVLSKDIPMVVDADLFYSKNILKILQKDSLVLTPHPKEFSSLLRLCGIADVDIEQIQSNRVHYALAFTQRYPNVILLLKGANPIIAQGEKLFINPLGTNALSKGGSGDVLTGLIGSLLAQGYSPLDAAISGSLALAIVAKRIKRANYALLPTDIIEEVGAL